MSVKNKLRKIIKGSAVGDSVWYYMHLANITLSSITPDKQYFERVYKKSHGKEINWDNPVTFDEKQLWLKLNYRNPLCVKCSDKYKVREYVKECGYEHILNPLYAVYDSVDDVRWEDLPERFYIKANHMSGCNARCNDPKTFDRHAAIRRLKRGMRHDYSRDSREWNYGPIDRKIIVEAIIEDKTNAPLVDYRFLCCNGHCDYIFIDIGTAGDDGKHLENARRNVYDRNMNLMDVQVSRERFPAELVHKPDNFHEMVEIAEKLSGHFPFCRVDLYNVDGRIIFGEITFFHAGGLSRITPVEWENILGGGISIDLAKRQIEQNYMTD